MEYFKDINLNLLLLHWIQSYLSGRSQQVLVNGATTCIVRCPSGISHWSSFVPDIYWYHQNNSLIWWKPSNIICWRYAAYRPITSTADCALLHKTLIAISDWVDRNYLQFNVHKFKFMHIASKKDHTQSTCFTPNPLWPASRESQHIQISWFVAVKWFILDPTH